MYVRWHHADVCLLEYSTSLQHSHPSVPGVTVVSAWRCGHQSEDELRITSCRLHATHCIVRACTGGCVVCGQLLAGGFKHETRWSPATRGCDDAWRVDEWRHRVLVAQTQLMLCARTVNFRRKTRGVSKHFSGWMYSFYTGVTLKRIRIEDRDNIHKKKL